MQWKNNFNHLFYLTQDIKNISYDFNNKVDIKIEITVTKILSINSS